MTATVLLPVPIFRAFDSAGDPLAGGLLYTYLANTSTPATTWSDYAGGTPNTNPVVLDTTGSATVRLDPTVSYKFVLTDSNGATQWTEDYYNPLTSAAIGYTLYPQSAGESGASVTPTNYNYIWGDVRRYGAEGDGTTDDTTAINNAILTGHQVLLQATTYKIASSLNLLTGTNIIGVNAQASILNYTGAGVAVTTSTPGVRTYNWILKDLRINNAGTGTTGILMDSVSMSYMTDVQIIGFTTQFDIYSPTSGYSVYNTFVHCLAQGATGYKLRGSSSNQNTFWACRGNLNTTRGFDITDGNGNKVYGGAIESGSSGTAVFVDASGAGKADANLFHGIRIENFSSGTGFLINSSNVRETMIVNPYIISSVTTPITDNGTRTQVWGINSSSFGNRIVSAMADASGTPFYFERTTAASTNPAFQIKDSNTGSGTPTTLNLDTGRSAGHTLSVSLSGTEKAYVLGSGDASFQKFGANGTAPLSKPTVTGSRGANAALASLLTALANYGLITDSSS